MTEAEKIDIADRNSHIPSAEILQDIIDTQKELDTMTEAFEFLITHFSITKSRVQLYFLREGILSRRRFIEKLEAILEVREKSNHGKTL